MQRGYRTLRSFDLPLAAPESSAQRNCTCGQRHQETCNCRYAVLLVFAPGSELTSATTVSIQGQANSTIVTLMSEPGDSELSAQFTPLLVEAVQHASDISATSVQNDQPASPRDKP